MRNKEVIVLGAPLPKFAKALIELARANPKKISRKKEVGTKRVAKDDSINKSEGYRTEILELERKWIHNNKHKLYKGDMKKFAQGANVKDKQRLYEMYKEDLCKGIRPLKFEVFVKELNAQTHGLKGGEVAICIHTNSEVEVFIYTQKLNVGNKTAILDFIRKRNISDDLNIDIEEDALACAQVTISEGTVHVWLRQEKPPLLTDQAPSLPWYELTPTDQPDDVLLKSKSLRKKFLDDLQKILDYQLALFNSRPLWRGYTLDKIYEWFSNFVKCAFLAVPKSFEFKERAPRLPKTLLEPGTQQWQQHVDNLKNYSIKLLETVSGPAGTEARAIFRHASTLEKRCGVAKFSNPYGYCFGLWGLVGSGGVEGGIWMFPYSDGLKEFFTFDSTSRLPLPLSYRRDLVSCLSQLRDDAFLAFFEDLKDKSRRTKKILEISGLTRNEIAINLLQNPSFFDTIIEYENPLLAVLFSALTFSECGPYRIHDGGKWLRLAIDKIMTRKNEEVYAGGRRLEGKNVEGF
jgi:hypothetical protein